jgi:arsenate reductase
MQRPDLELLAPEQQRLVRRAVEVIHHDFTGTFGRETIERLVADSLAQLSATARVATHLPLLTERFARQRLRALAVADGARPSHAPSVLFVCVHNAGRSQMAAGWMKHLTRGWVTVWTAGSQPGPELNPAVVDAMREVGIDISAEFPKPWTDEVVRAADVVVTMGCGDACPIHPGVRYEDWDLPPLQHADPESARAVRDEIRRRVEHLAAALHAVAP